MGDNTRKVALDDFSTERTLPVTTKAAAYFKNLESNLIKHIKTADAVVGCVAWLTSDAVLEALAEKNAASIIIQKEDFLRPDLDSSFGCWKTKLRARYDSIKPISTPNNDFSGWFETANTNEVTGFGSPFASVGIRCVGHHRGSEVTQPRMHHKFLVFLRHVDPKDICEEEDSWPYAPFAVWTGSFNVTKNGSASLENALYLEDSAIAAAFCKEWAQLVEISEPLDWENEYATPEIYFNTGGCFS